MKQAEIKVAGPVGDRVLNFFGFVGITSPWRTVYVKAEWLHDAALIRHETAHLAQMKRDGWLRFWVQCVWWCFVLGYDKSPYEIEAREAEWDVNHPVLDGWDVPRC